jgi:CheY-like chemotaxis protein
MPDLVAAHAEDGAEAVRLALELQPDLVVLDIQMPTMTGLEATRRLKKSRATSSIPVIAVTGVDFPAGRATEAGCDGYIEKPLSSEQLYAEVCRVLKRPAAPVVLRAGSAPTTSH